MLTSVIPVNQVSQEILNVNFIKVETVCKNMCAATNAEAECEECHEGYQLDSSNKYLTFRH